RLGAKVLDVATTKDVIGAWRFLVNEDWPDFGQRPRVLEEERVADRRGELVEGVVALEQGAVALGQVQALETAGADAADSAAEAAEPVLALAEPAGFPARRHGHDAAVVPFFRGARNHCDARRRRQAGAGEFRALGADDAGRLQGGRAVSGAGDVVVRDRL